MLFTYSLLVGLGCALGGMMRFWICTLCQSFGFPLLGTLVVNVLGCFLAGLLVSLAYEWLQPYQTFIRFFFIIGMLGGLTTFSAFSLDIFQLGRELQITQALLYATFSISLSLFATITGFMFGNQVSIQLIKI